MRAICHTNLCKLFIGLSIVIGINGCATYADQQAGVRNNLLAGKIKEARALVEKEDESKEDVLASMNKGILRRMTGDYAGSNEIFSIAKKRIEELYGVSISGQIGATVVNDSVRDYSGDRYEQILVNAYLALNYLELDDIDAARVEMLQADVKMREWGEQPEEDPFVRYLSGMVFEALGESDQALVSYRQAKKAYEATQDKNLVGLPGFVKDDLLRLLHKERLYDELDATLAGFSMSSYRPEKLGNNGEVIVLLHNGLAPLRGETSIRSYSNQVQQNLKIALPTYPYDPAPLMRAEVVGGGFAAGFETLENIDSLARAALSSDMPGITARALARAVVKASTQKEANDQNPWAGLFMTVLNVASEVADTRSWTTLPQEIQMAKLMLPAGQQNVKINMINAAGQIVDTIDETITIKPGKRVILSRHWAAPVQISTQQTPVASAAK